MKSIDTVRWQQVITTVKQACPRISEQDFVDCEQRVDLLAAKIQNRHWVSRVAADDILRAALGSAS